MAIKFERNYQLFITGNDGALIEIKMPFSVEFDIQKNQIGGSNSANFRIYNLKKERRNQIRKDEYSVSEFRPVIFKAGYGPNLSDVFIGNVSTAVSQRNGVDYITEVSCFGGAAAFANSISSQQFRSGTPVDTILRDLISNFKGSGVNLGAIGNFDGTISRGNSYVGGTADLLGQITGGAFFVDNNKAYCLKDNECINGQLQVIDSSFGILSTPIAGFSAITFDMLFEPRLTLAQFIRLDLTSFTDQNSNSVNPDTKKYNGPYKIVELKHRGIISPVVAGSAITSVKLFTGNTALSVVGSQ